MAVTRCDGKVVVSRQNQREEMEVGLESTDAIVL
jgi:hypothetical protein